MQVKHKRILGLSALAVALVGTVALADRADQRGEGRGEGGGPGMQMLERFDEIDANKDGLLSPEEIDAFHAARFAAADTDGNGTLSAEELMAMQEQMRQERMANRATRMVERLDTDGDGQLSATEMAAMGPRGKGKSPMERADTDGDGMISKAEAEAAVKHMAERGGKHGRGGKGDRND